MATTVLNGKTLSTIDLATLQAITSRCFELSMDSAIPLDHQLKYNALGNRLTGDLATLTSAFFDATAPQFASANAALGTVNTQLSRSAAQLAAAVQTVNALSQLAQTLDGLLKIVEKFA